MDEYEKYLKVISKKIKVDPEFINRLQNKITSLEKENKSLHNAAEDTDNELAKLRLENQDLLAENHRLKENIRSYIRDADLSNSTNKQLRLMMGEKHKENVALRATLKAVL